MRTRLLTLIGCALLALNVFAADKPATPERSKVVAAAKDVMQKAEYCSLITIGDEGQPQARIVDPFAPEGDFTVWIGTRPVTRKVDQIRRNNRTTLIYFDKGGMGYVTLLGTAQVVTDPAEKAKHWKKQWAGFYSDENRGDDYVLIRFKPARLEMVSYANGLTGDPKTWRPIELDLR